MTHIFVLLLHSLIQNDLYFGIKLGFMGFYLPKIALISDFMFSVLVEPASSLE